MKKEFAVIGLGRFGGSICRTLVELGVDVLAIDNSIERVNHFSSIASHAVVADSTDEPALRSLGIRNYDHVIVAIGENIQASILTTIILKELGVKEITVKATNDYHEKVLRKIGADRIIHPERDMGIRVAHQVVSKNVVDYLDLNDNHSIVEVVVTKEMVNKSLIELNVRSKFGINVVALKREGNIIVSPKPTDIIVENDILIIIGADEDINKFEKSYLS